MSGLTNFGKNSLPVITVAALKRGLVKGDGRDYHTKRFKYNSVALGFASLNFKEQDPALAQATIMWYF